jgi:CBS domain containing-hemolysin-like protein
MASEQKVNVIGVAAIIACLILCAVPLAIVQIIMGAVPSTCDITDIMGLNTGSYLLGLGIASLITTVLSIIFLGIVACEITPIATATALTIQCCISVSNILFGIAWLIIGGIILFRSNIGCIQEGGARVIFALVMWCLSVVNIWFSNGAKSKIITSSV